MRIPRLTQQEHDILKDLAEKGPLRRIPTPLSGRLVLYRLADETPQGWIIAPAGKDALNTPAPSTPDVPTPHPSRRLHGRRKARINPFD
jgi:hypothetical protein